MEYLTSATFRPETSFFEYFAFLAYFLKIGDSFRKHLRPSSKMRKKKKSEKKVAFICCSLTNLRVQPLEVIVILVNRKKHKGRSDSQRTWGDHTWSYQVTLRRKHHVTMLVPDYALLFYRNLNIILIFNGIQVLQRRMCNASEV